MSKKYYVYRLDIWSKIENPINENVNIVKGGCAYLSSPDDSRQKKQHLIDAPYAHIIAEGLSFKRANNLCAVLRLLRG